MRTGLAACALLLAACTTTSQSETAQSCNAVAAEAVDAANGYLRLAGDSLDQHDPFFSGPTPPPLPVALDDLPRRFEEAGCPRSNAGDALRLRATDVRGDGVGAQAVRQAMRDGDVELRRLNDAIRNARPPS